MNKLKTFLLLIAVTTIYTSCTKDSKLDPDPDKNDSATIIGFKDSTLLIKSVTKLKIDFSGNYIDSSTFYVYYDSLKRKINFNSEYTSSPTPTMFSSVHSYNSAGLLVQLDRSDVTGRYTNNYIYDAQNVISSATIEEKDRAKRTFYFTKKMLSEGGYSLSVNDSTSFQFDHIDFYSFNFNGNDQLTKVSTYFTASLNDGMKDSIYYDGFGNVSKVIQTRYVPGYPVSIHTPYQFFSRDTKGDQYYNFNKKVMNGIANLPKLLYGYFDVGNELVGMENIYLYQFSKFPALSASFYKYFNGDYPYVNFKPEAEYDSKDRLVKFKLYLGDELFLGDDAYFSDEYRLTYYK